MLRYLCLVFGLKRTKVTRMNFSLTYALIFGLAGFSAAAYHIAVGDRVKWMPLIGLVVCVAFVWDNYNEMYAFLTAIEYAIGFGLAHSFVGKNKK